MAGNLKALSVEELKYFLDRYDIDLVGDYIVVTCKTLKRKTLHDLDKGFPLSTPVKKMNITRQAIELWRKDYIGHYSLIEVQNAINTLIITYQNVNDLQIREQLKRTKSKYYNTIEGE